MHVCGTACYLGTTKVKKWQLTTGKTQDRARSLAAGSCRRMTGIFAAGRTEQQTQTRDKTKGTARLRHHLTTSNPHEHNSYHRCRENSVGHTNNMVKSRTCISVVLVWTQIWNIQNFQSQILRARTGTATSSAGKIEYKTQTNSYI